MTCGDVAQLLDAFVDAELPAPTLLAVARHAGACPSCDLAVRALTTLHDSIEQAAREEAETLDMSGVWPAVENGIERAESRQRWVRRARRVPTWGLALAAAASAFLWFQAPPRCRRPVTSLPCDRVRTRPSSSASTATARASSCAASGSSARR
jgi:anti-sigma factor RsiW